MSGFMLIMRICALSALMVTIFRVYPEMLDTNKTASHYHVNLVDTRTFYMSQLNADSPGKSIRDEAINGALPSSVVYY